MKGICICNRMVHSRIIKTECGLETAIQMMSQSVLRTLALASLPDQTSS